MIKTKNNVNGGTAHFHAGLLYETNAFAGRLRALQMKRVLSGARLAHVLDPAFGRVHHHVHVKEGVLDVRAQTFDDGMAER